MSDDNVHVAIKAIIHTIFASLVSLDVICGFVLPMALRYRACKLLIGRDNDLLSKARHAGIQRSHSASNICVNRQRLKSLSGLDVSRRDFRHGPDNLLGFGLQRLIGKDDKIPLSLGLFGHWETKHLLCDGLLAIRLASFTSNVPYQSC
jgi:hypothetical protein